MQNTIPAGSKERHFSLSEQAQAFAVVLREEFGIPFTLCDATTGEVVWSEDPDELAEASAGWKQSLIQQMATEEQARVTPMAKGQYQLILPLHEDGRLVLIAVGVLSALTRAASEAAQEQVRLQKWLQSVQIRLRGSNQSVPRSRGEVKPETMVGGAWEALLSLDQLARRVRIHKEPDKHQRRILQAAAEALRAQTLIWIAQQPEGFVLIHGESCLSPWDCRQLAALLTQSPDWQKSGLILCNEVASTAWGKCYPQIHNLLALPMSGQGTPGWIIALNKKDALSRPAGADASERTVTVRPGRANSAPETPPASAGAAFRRSDAVLLTPFAGLFGLHQRACGRYAELKELLVGLTRSLTAAIDAKDSYTFGHSERVARVAVELGSELGLPQDELSDFYLAGLLHDIGKIGIRDAVLCKHGALTPEEMEHMRQHVTIGYNILAQLDAIRHLLPGVLYHHERYDGQGYPEGLKGSAIPLLPRILAVADGYDAMSSSRPYRAAMPCSRVEEILQQGAGSQWDKQVVDAFFRARQKIYAIHQRGIGASLVQALDGALRREDSVASQVYNPVKGAS
jgi:HD-GYP domain-containing protein (c-di-GMP phosphodiesterase class II)